MLFWCYKLLDRNTTQNVYVLFNPMNTTDYSSRHYMALILFQVVVDVLGRLLCIRGPSGGAASSDVGMTSMDPHSPDNASDKTDMETQTVLPQQKKTLPQEWKLIARVLDRLMFFIFLVICFICILFLWAYYWYVAMVVPRRKNTQRVRRSLDGIPFSTFVISPMMLF